jgi:hypothetical protein
MKVFGFEPGEWRDEYRERGWIHVRGGIEPGFLEYLRDFARREFSAHKVEGTAIGGRKTQSLFEFPDEVDFPGHLFDVVAEVCGLRRETMTLSERHIKAYDADAPPSPPAHKDRHASQVSVGLSIDIPVDSRLVLYPFSHRDLNPYNISAALKDRLPPEQQPEAALEHAQPVEIADQPGDVVMFPGSTVWHLRRNAAGAVNLYLKFNDFECDPLGEDPETPRRRSDTLAALNGSGLGSLIPLPSRRLDTIAREETRGGGRLLEAHVFDEPPVLLDQARIDLLRELDGKRDVRALLDELAARGVDAGEADVRYLAEREVIDLVSAGTDQTPAPPG